MPEAPPATLEEFGQLLGMEVDPPGWIEGGSHGTVSCAPGGGFHILIYGYTPRGQERVTYAFAKFARLAEVHEDGDKLFRMDRLPNAEEAKTIRGWLSP